MWIGWWRWARAKLSRERWACAAGMCRNITELRGLEPAATPDEVLAAARQYVRRVSGMREPNDRGRDAFERAVAEAAASTTRLLGALPARRRPPTTVPPLRRPEVRARMAAQERPDASTRADRRTKPVLH